MRASRRYLLGLALLALCLAVPVAFAAAAGFEDPTSNKSDQEFVVGGPEHRTDKPNDPEYDRAEDPDPSVSTMYEERYDLFGFPSKHTPLAVYNDPLDTKRFLKPQISGFNASGAWKRHRGRPDVVVAVLDTGIQWNASGLRTQVHLNADELPLPRRADGTTNPGAGLNGYDLDGDGALTVDDYKDDARVGKAEPTGQDLIRAFQDGTDAEGNGFVDDIAGWDFFDDDNDAFDSSSYFAAKNHGTGRVEEAVRKGNDGEGDLGVCPKCQFMPIRIWDTFVSDQNSFALGVLYATDNGAAVIEGADGGLYHSAFMEQASQYAYDHGVVQVYSGDDLNTANHNYPAAYGHAMLIQGVVTDSEGLGENNSELAILTGDVPVGSQVPVRTYFRSANTAQFGGKSSISMEGATGSQNTGKSSGAAALVISTARAKGIDLKPDETRSILEQTAEDVLPLNGVGTGNADPAQLGWDSHFGWGRVNLGDAVKVADEGKIPPEASIDSPDWYAPLTGDEIAIKGRAASPRANNGAFTYTLEWGVGQAPLIWNEIGSGTSTTPLTDLGTIDLTEVRQAILLSPPPLDPAGPVFSLTDPNPMRHEFTVRLTVDAAGIDTPGVDRRVLNAFTDTTLRSGFPKRLGAGGEAPLRYADIDGDNVQELVAPVEDGTIHAYKPDGTELDGWPVETDEMVQAANHAGSPAIDAVSVTAPALEPPRAPVIADLDADGIAEIITAAGRHIYVWQPDGTRRPGFPVEINPDFCRPEDQEQATDEKPRSVHRKCGFLATPAVARLHGKTQPPSIVAPALDGHVYAFDGDGETVTGYPVDLVDPGVPAGERMYAESINQPAIGDLNGDEVDDIVVASHEAYGSGTPDPTDLNGAFSHAVSVLLGNALGGTSRLYAIDGKTGEFLDGWPVKLAGAIQDTLPLIGPGHDATIARISGEEPEIVASTTGSASIEVFGADGSFKRSMQEGVHGPDSNAVEKAPVNINLFESAIVADVAGAGLPSVVKYALGAGQLANLALVGQNFPYHHLIGAWDGTTGAPLPAFPRVTDDYQFLSSSTVAKVDAISPARQVLAGTGLGQLHAYDGITGLNAPGFPKYTGGWLFAPAEVSNDGRMASITREGYLFEWTVDSPKCQPAGAWPTFRHDEQGSGNYDADGTPPGAVADLAIIGTGDDRQVRFTSPGDDRMCGTATEYVARLEGGGAIDLGAPGAGATVVTRDADLPASGTLIVQARDDAGNLGHPGRVTFAPPPVVTPTPSQTATATATSSATATPTASPDGTATATATPEETASATATATATTQPQTTPNVAPFDTCRDLTAPVSRFTGGSITRTRLKLRGTSADSGCAGSLREVRIAVMRGRPDGDCHALLPSGRFSAPRSCLRTTYLPARGTSSWSFTRSRSFPRGNYTIWVRGIDRAGNVERKAAQRNRRKLVRR